MKKQVKLVIVCNFILSLNVFGQLIINNSGNVGIGSVSEGEKARIDGGSTGLPSIVTINNCTGTYSYAHKFFVNNSTTKSMSIWWGGSERYYVSGNGTPWSASDRQLKENIKLIQTPLKKVLLLNGVTYNFLNENDQEKQMGLIAQEVEEVVPEVVATNEKGQKAIAYQNLIGLLIEAIKEQQTHIEDFQTKANKLESQLSYCCAIKQQQEGNSTVGSSTQTGNISNQQIETLSEKPFLLQNNPNPFNQKTTIGYYLPLSTQSASLIIFDMQGKLIKSIPVTNYGNASIVINANDLNSGMYIYSLVADGKEIDNKRMILTE